MLAFRLGVSAGPCRRRLAKANAYSDIYVLWQPYTFQDNSPYGVKSATSWALGVTVPLPIYNRNQGGISRAKMNVDQSSMQLADAERQALIDIEEALQEYRGLAASWSRSSVTRSMPGRQGDTGRDVKLLETRATEHPRLHRRPARIQRQGQAVSATPRRDTGGACWRSIRWSARRSCREAGTGRVARSVSWPGPARPRPQGGDDGTPNRRGLRPDLELFERRELLSAITDFMAATASHSRAASRGASSRPAPRSRRRSNQGPPLDRVVQPRHSTPTGTLNAADNCGGRDSRRHSRRTYSVVPGRTSTQAIQTLIRAPGPPTRCCTATSRSGSSPPRIRAFRSAVSARSSTAISTTNTTLGFDISAPQQDVDRGGRPDHFPTVTIDVNVSSGVYVESYAQGP